MEVPESLRYSWKLCHYAKGPISEGAVAVGDWGSLAPVHTSFTSLLLSVLCSLWYTMVNMGHHGYIETDRM